MDRRSRTGEGTGRHGRAWEAESGSEEKGREMEGKMGVCLDRLSYDLDTEFTTKSRLRALKLT